MMDVDMPVASGSGSSYLHESLLTRSSAFNPASYNRQFLGSPISWRGASFGSRFYPACSPGAQFLAPMDATDYKLDRVSSSCESDRDSIRTFVNAIDHADQQCRNYTCCGLDLLDLHALVDHFEECHVLMLDPNMPELDPHSNTPLRATPGAFDVDDMEMDDGDAETSGSGPSSGASTPPPVTPSSLRGCSPPTFGTYASYSEFNTAGNGHSSRTPPPGSEGSCVQPDMLFSASGSPSSSRNGSPAPRASPTGSSGPGIHPYPGFEKASKHGNSHGHATARASTTLSRPSSSLLLSKPFKCPKPHCSKSYKQANGLKYHITHGSCSFAPAKEVAEVNAVLAQRGRAALPEGMSASELDAGLGALGVSEREVREIEREAEKRLKPFACGIADCTRRYKNMNGLRYHYQHSGDHGAIGLALLASGQHECLRNGQNKGAARHLASVAASAAASASASAMNTPTSSSSSTSTPTPTMLSPTYGTGVTAVTSNATTAGGALPQINVPAHVAGTNRPFQYTAIVGGGPGPAPSLSLATSLAHVQNMAQGTGVAHAMGHNLPNMANMSSYAQGGMTHGSAMAQAPALGQALTQAQTQAHPLLAAYQAGHFAGQSQGQGQGFGQAAPMVQPPPAHMV